MDNNWEIPLKMAGNLQKIVKNVLISVYIYYGDFLQ